MENAPLMLSVSGLRGIVGASLDDDVIARYVRASATFLARRSSARRVVLGRDGRVGGEAIARATSDAWLANGFDVVDVGVAATPTTALMVAHHDAAGGMEVTASHNPAQWNGLKLFTAQGRAPSALEAAEVVAAFYDDAPQLDHCATPGAVIADPSATDIHVQRILDHIDAEPIRARKFTVVLDAINASGAVGGKKLLHALGCEVIELNCDGTGRFAHTPEPTEENLTDLCAHVASSGADIGFAQDPDADRLAIVDETGRYIGEEYTLILVAQRVLDKAGPSEHTVVTNLSTSRMIDDLAAEYENVTILRSAVGEANVVTRMTQAGAIVGGEGNGGVVWPVIGHVRDSLVGMALVLALLADAEQSLSTIVDAIPRYAIIKVKMPIQAGLADRAIAGLARIYDDERLDTQDGIRIDFERSWVHVRPSNTEPILRIIAEAPTHDEAQNIVREVQLIIA
ncbi:MAG: phosphoglucosamine mutase [Phycisphaerales bacterium]|nr:phosphoglucosamine mutase [Phycisphaerales bacterium]